MSAWQRWHACWDCVKNSLGMGPPVLVEADDGKNGPWLPPIDSSSIVSGAVGGFATTGLVGTEAARVPQRPAGRITTAARSTPRAHPRRRSLPRLGAAGPPTAARR